MNKISIFYKLIIVLIGSLTIINGFFPKDFKFDMESAYYFTYQSNIFVVLYFIADVFYILKTKKTFMPRLKGAVTMSITVTFLVYHFLLSPTVNISDNATFIRNTILHYVIPLMTILDYAVFDKKGNYKAMDPILWLIIPLAYFVFTLIRAEFGNELSNGSRYPYFFIDVNKYGLRGVARNVFFNYRFLYGFGLCGILYRSGYGSV